MKSKPRFLLYAITKLAVQYIRASGVLCECVVKLCENHSHITRSCELQYKMKLRREKK